MQTTESHIANQIKVHCAHSDIVSIKDLKPNPKNPNTHPQGQIEILAKVIREQGWRQPIKVSNQSGYIVSGHGRYEAAIFMGADFVPVDYQDYASEAEELADLLADNRIAELAEMDEKLLAALMADIDIAGLDTDLTGYDKDAAAALADIVSSETEAESEYTTKVTTPIYEPTEEEPPSIKRLYDSYKMHSLIEDIESDPSITEEEREFLKLAAARHVVFDYRNIAEYYAHASKPMQDLMEDSALVIIDFEKAIEHGYVKIKSGISDELGETLSDGAVTDEI